MSEADYLQTFVDETSEQLDDLTEVLLVLERESDSTEELNEAFRLIHSIKGAAGVMGYDRIAVLTHHLENRFETLRTGVTQLDERTMSLVLRSIDFLRACVEQLRQGEPMDSPGALVEEAMALNEKEPEPAPPVAEPEPADEPEPAPVESEGAMRVIVTFEPDLPLTDLKARLVLKRLGQLGDIAATEPDAEALAAADAVPVIAVTIATSAAPATIRDAVSLDGVASIEVEAEKEPEPEPIPDPIPEPAPIPAPEPEPEAPATRAPAARTGETMRVDIDRLDTLLNLAGELVVNRARFVQLAQQLGSVFLRRGVVDRARDLHEQIEGAIGRIESLEGTNGAVARELEEIRAGLRVIEEQNELWDSGRQGYARFGEALDQLTRISNNLQQSVLDTRMVPVAPLFTRFKRVVRDLSTERGKIVELGLRGEKTELDKRMIDELVEPMVHLVRNSIDHGLESPEVRRERGKPERGTISLEASQRGNNILISIRDDGGGIDVARIKERIASRGILPQAAIDELTHEEALEYIWHPGFSTAKEITDISGRGVGMDAVRTRIGQLNGTVELESVSGEGTTFTIRLPLTLAIIGSFLVRIRDTVFSIPADDVREIVKAAPSDVVSIQNRQAVDVRGEFIPLVRITDLFDWRDFQRNGDVPAAPTTRIGEDEIDAVILKSGERAMALRVDESIGSQEIVIKSLSEHFVPIRGLSGASILGDGTVCLMLDVATLMHTQEGARE
ncbi:MAG: chemotaxis protein CheA [Planctomycetota bacterium]